MAGRRATRLRRSAPKKYPTDVFSPHTWNPRKKSQTAIGRRWHNYQMGFFEGGSRYIQPKPVHRKPSRKRGWWR